jgi:hypothetical protein
MWHATITGGANVTLDGTQTSAIQANGTYSASVGVLSANGQWSASAPPATIAGTPPLHGARQTPYTFTFTLGGAPTPTTAISAGQLPPGLSLSTNGMITGTPTTNGTYVATVTASNGDSPPVTDTFTIDIGPHFVTTSLPAATRGALYGLQINVADGVPPYKFGKIGKLPKGLKLTKTGILYGIPSLKIAAGDYTITIKVKDAAKKPTEIITTTYTLTIT